VQSLPLNHQKLKAWQTGGVHVWAYERGEAMFGAAGRRTVIEEQNIPFQDLTRVLKKKH
jgi:hypothetical protein